MPRELGGPSEKEMNLNFEVKTENLSLSEDEISEIIKNSLEYKESIEDVGEGEANKIYSKRIEQAETIVKQLKKAISGDPHNAEIGFRNTELDFDQGKTALIDARDEAKALAAFKEKTLELYEKSNGKFLEGDFEKIFQSTDEFMTGDVNLIKKRENQLKEIMEQCKKQNGKGYKESVSELQKVARESDNSLKLRQDLAGAFEKKYYEATHGNN